MNTDRSIQSVSAAEADSNFPGQKARGSVGASSIAGTHSHCPRIYEEMI